MRHVKNNKGLSLVELIVAFAITAIAGVAVFGLMSAGSNHFNSTGKDVGLQYEQQVVVNRLRDELIEASNTISYDASTKTLLVYSRKDMGITTSGATMHTFEYVMTKIFLSGNELMYTTGQFPDLDPSNLDGLTPSLLGEDVSDLEFDLADVEKGQIRFEITFEVDGKTISSEQVVALRNAIQGVTPSGDVLLLSTDTFGGNNIISVQIYRETVPLSTGSTSVISLYGESMVSVPFTYKVTASETSREYLASWDITPHTDGISVNSDGIVTVDPTKIMAGSTFTLVCTSMDDSRKSSFVNIVIENDGVYPEALVDVKEGGATEYVGYRDYIIYPEIRYTDGSVKTDGDLCTWKVEINYNDAEKNKDKTLPVGSYFKLDETSKRYTFRATSQLNGATVKFTATVKAPKVDGTKCASKTLTLNISGIKDASDNNEMKLFKQDDMYNKRGSDVTVMAVWQKTNSVSNYTYHWKIESNGDDTWGRTGDDRSDFGKTIRLNTRNMTSEGDGWYKSNAGLSYAYLSSSSWLDWSKEYQVKVLCYATDKNGKRYGIGNEIEENYTGPVETIVAYKPVKVILRPMDTYYESNTKSMPLVNSRQLKRAVKLGDDGKTYVQENIDGIGSKTIRLFEISATGVAYSSADTSTISISTPGEDIRENTIFTFLNSSQRNVGGTKAEIKGFFNQYTTWQNHITGFTVSMDETNFKDFYSKFNGSTTYTLAEKPVYVNVKFKASDSKGNRVDTYFQTGNNVYSDRNLTPTGDYLFEIVYDPTKLNDPNFVEIRGAKTE